MVSTFKGYSMKRLLIVLFCFLCLSPSALAASKGGYLDFTPKILALLIKEIEKEVKFPLKRAGDKVIWGTEMEGEIVATLVGEERDGYISRIQIMAICKPEDKKNSEKYINLRSTMIFFASGLLSEGDMPMAHNLAELLTKDFNAAKANSFVVDFRRSRVALYLQEVKDREYF